MGLWSFLWEDKMLNNRYNKVVKSGKYRFHYHQARIYWYLFEDGTKQTEFWSYSTPIIVKLVDNLYMNDRRYSITTQRQKFRYIRENGLLMDKMELVNEDFLRQICL